MGEGFLFAMAAAAAASSLPSCSFVGLDKTGSGNGGSLRLTEGFFEQGRVPAIRFRRREKLDASIRSGRAELKISCCFKKNSGEFVWLRLSICPFC